MKITPQLPLNSLQISQLSSNALQSLRGLVGQTVNLTVNDVRQNTVNLQLGNQSLQAQTNLDLKPQTQIQAKVTEQNGQLRLIVQAQPQVKTEVVSQNFLRTALPNQMPLNQTLTFLSQPQILQQLPPAIQNTITQLLEQILRPTLLDARRLEQAIRASGQFLENALKTRPGSDLSKDVKANLFKLQQQLQQQLSAKSSLNRTNAPQPGLVQALTMVKQSVQAISLNQFQQLEQKDNLISSLAIESQQKVEPINLEIKRKNYQKQEFWEVVLQMGISSSAAEEVQSLECKISMSEAEEFKVWFYSENQELISKVSDKLDHLKKSFNNSGLALNLLEISSQPIVEKVKNRKHGLIDIKI